MLWSQKVAGYTYPMMKKTYVYAWLDNSFDCGGWVKRPKLMTICYIKNNCSNYYGCIIVYKSALVWIRASYRHRATVHCWLSLLTYNYITELKSIHATTKNQPTKNKINECLNTLLKMSEIFLSSIAPPRDILHLANTSQMTWILPLKCLLDNTFFSSNHTLQIVQPIR